MSEFSETDEDYEKIFRAAEDKSEVILDPYGYIRDNIDTGVTDSEKIEYAEHIKEKYNVCFDPEKYPDDSLHAEIEHGPNADIEGRDRVGWSTRFDSEESMMSAREEFLSKNKDSMDSYISEHQLDIDKEQKIEPYVNTISTDESYGHGINKNEYGDILEEADTSHCLTGVYAWDISNSEWKEITIYPDEDVD